MVIQADEKNFKELVLESKKLVFVDFYAPWCGPCQVTAPVIDQIAEERKETSFVKVDVDKNGQIASQYNVFSIPTFIIFNQGKVITQFTGAMGKERFIEEIEKAI
ncbi:thioredoxin [Candidatus Roizmanbacteria bacterium CG_4_9_14_0_8_um_filter_34_12]|uniref:Thioredoxin n=4 Tax=Candidatus Roizmaniibacteriota TaxID=1752723 RepID=A0A2M7E4P6_9BACT|nr:MAG: thioredoxin [Candidatus Roizmanbacteria bacterium CG22_combo_CG10-13_8_21_14_all_33_16]PIV62691.1 MAG: thioredoxin [Candidatus Roizmanbacteria bacterium CG01_land_8_20_14_3_00_33_9]PIX73833.1 MAG: thioredoxin [Candidatus Roizmanbacteria bacterium CG_4_10_14_3_um_filter_33_21]PJB88016.1 MAG: thioredoxin [Candidatus Roizmanbacteria bacterium CG_4_9_14_0_8_um_filter_34_12]